MSHPKKKTPFEILALIPARGGSTGVPGKNHKILNGKPLVAYTIEIAKASSYINRVVVATDDPKIAKVSIDFGADVPISRPTRISQKLSRAYDVYHFFLDHLRKSENYVPDIFVVMVGTSYSRTLKEVDAAIEKLITTNCDWVFTVTEAEHHPYRMFTLEDDKLNPFCKDVSSWNIWGNRQELPLTYRINGNAFVTWTQNITKHKTYNIGQGFDSDVRYILCPQSHSMDIDTPFDFEIAEYLMKKRR